MVYDGRSNFIGDTHWREEHTFGEGEELELERGGMLVEVGECIGRDDQDLTELIDKRVKEREERFAAKIIISPATSIHRSGIATPAASAMGRPKPLNALLGTPSGHYGRAAVSIVSPFEQREKANNSRGAESEERPAKRRKHMASPLSKHGYAQSLTGVPLTLSSSRPLSSATIRHEPLRFKSTNQRAPMQNIDLTKDDDESSERHGINSGNKEQPQKPTAKIRMLERKQERFENSYANNLVGTALTLSAHHPSKTRVLSKSSASTTGRARQVELEPSDEETPLPEAPTRTKRRSKTVKSLRAGAKESRSAKSSPNRRSTPPRLKDKTIRKMGASAKTNDDHQNRTHLDHKTSPIKNLRIKPRETPKMRMLTNRSSSNATIRSDSSEKALPAAKARTSNRHFHAPALSQATIQLHTFRQKQEDMLRARLDGHRPKIQIDASSSSEATQSESDDEEAKLEEVFSLVDVGIDHNMIDAVLFKGLCSKDPMNESKWQSVCEAESRSVVMPPLCGTEFGLENMTNVSDGDKPLKAPLLERIAEQSVSIDSSTSNGKTIGPTPQYTKQDTMTPLHFAKGRGYEAGSSKMRSACPLSHGGHTADQQSTHDIRAQLAPGPFSEVGAPHRNSSVGQVSEAVFAATDHFRKRLFPHGVPKSINTNDHGRQVQTGAAALKMEPSPIEGGIGHLHESANRSLMIKGGSENEILAHPTGNAAACGFYRKPKQTKLNQEQLAPSTSGPPPPQTLATVQRNSADNLAKRASGSGSGRGPWSREAFDLFGSWRPP